MSSPSKIIFLRRTLAALVAVAGSFAASDAAAQTSAPKVTLKTSTGDVFCDYSDINMKPNGSVTVTCGTTPIDPPPVLDPNKTGTFAMATASMSGAQGSIPTITVNRTVGGMAHTIYYWYTGEGCLYTSPGALAFGLNQASAQFSAPLSNAAVGSKCTVHLAEPGGPSGILGSPARTEITLTQGNQPVPGCPAEPQGLMEVTLPAAMGTAIRPLTTSGQIVTMKVPATGLISGQVSFSDSPGAYSPNPFNIEISVNKCKGHIDTDMTNQCNFRTNTGVLFGITYFMKAFGVIVDEDSAKRYSQCWAGNEGTQYYINARWTHQGCAYGQLTCGWNVQHNQGPY